MTGNYFLAKSNFDNGDLESSINLLNDMLLVNPDNEEALLLRGLAFYRMQKWGEAINDFSSVLELKPDHTEAKLRLEMAENILGYFTPDLFNP